MLKYLYVSRCFNRSGYYIFKHLLHSGRHVPAAVLLPCGEGRAEFNTPEIALVERERYFEEAKNYNCKPIKFMKSIKLLAAESGIPVMEAKSIKDDKVYGLLRDRAYDLIALGGGWPELLPKKVIDLPRLGIINTHPSLLPQYRGTDVHRWQVRDGVSESGVTIHYVDETFDTGHIILQKGIAVPSGSTPQELADQLGRLAGSMMVDVLDNIVSTAPNRVEGVRQYAREDSSLYYSRWPWENDSFLRINWSDSAEKIHRFVLACTQESFKYNGPYFYLKGKKYIIRNTSLRESSVESSAPGGIVSADEHGIAIKCGSRDTVLLLKQVQQASITPPHTNSACACTQLMSESGVKVGDTLSSVDMEGGGVCH